MCVYYLNLYSNKFEVNFEMSVLNYHEMKHMQKKHRFKVVMPSSHSIVVTFLTVKANILVIPKLQLEANLI